MKIWITIILLNCSIEVLSQNKSGDIIINDSNRIAYSIFNTGNFNNIIQTNIKSMTDCQQKHWLTFQSLSIEKYSLTTEYRVTKKLIYKKMADSIAHLMENELNSVTVCDLKEKITNRHPELNCPFDYIEKADMLYGNLDFIDAFLWYSDALKCIIDVDLKRKTSVKMEVCKRKIIQNESFLNSKEYSKISICKHDSLERRLFFKSKVKSNGHLLTIVSSLNADNHSEYKIPLTLIQHDTFGKIFFQDDLEEINYNNLKFISFDFLMNNDILISIINKDSVTTLYHFDSFGHIKRIKHVDMHFAQVISNQKIILLYSKELLQVYDLDLNFLYKINKNEISYITGQDHFNDEFDEYVRRKNVDLYVESTCIFLTNEIYNYKKFNEDSFSLKILKLDYYGFSKKKVNLPNNFETLHLNFETPNTFIAIFNLKSQNLWFTDSFDKTYYHIYKNDKYIKTWVIKNNKDIAKDWAFCGTKNGCLFFQRIRQLGIKYIADSMFLSLFDTFKSIKSSWSNFYNINDFYYQGNKFNWNNKNSLSSKNGILTISVGIHKIKIKDIELNKYYNRLNLPNPEIVKDFSGKQISGLANSDEINWSYNNYWKKWVKIEKFENVRLQESIKMEIYDRPNHNTHLYTRNFQYEFENKIEIFGFDNSYCNNSIPFYTITPVDFHFKSNHNKIVLWVLDSNLSNKYTAIEIEDFKKVKDRNLNYFKKGESILSINVIGNNVFILSTINEGENDSIIIHRHYDTLGNFIGKYYSIADIKDDRFTIVRNVALDSIFAKIRSTVSNYYQFDYYGILFFSKKSNCIVNNKFWGNSILVSKNNFIVTGINKRFNSECYILDSNWNCLASLGQKLNGSSFAKLPVVINDSVYACIIEETADNSDEYQQNGVQSYIIIFSKSGNLLFKKEIKTFGFNSIKSIEYNKSAHSLIYYGFTNHFRVINGKENLNEKSSDLFKDEWILPNL